MPHLRTHPIRTVVASMVALLAMAAVGQGLSVAADSPPTEQSPPTPGGLQHGALVPDLPRTDLPTVLDGEVLALAEVNGTIIVGGTFTQVRDANGVVRSLPYLFAYDLETGALDTGFSPTPDRDVTSLVADPDGDGVYVGGRFNNIGGKNRRKVARLDLAGVADANFVANASAKVDRLAIDDTRLYLGGSFEFVNGTPRGYLAAVDADTGATDAGFDLPLTGPLGLGGFIGVKALNVVPGTGELFVSHSARYVGGLERVGAAFIDVSGPTATVTPWETRIWADNLDLQGGQLRLRDGDVSPDGSYVVVVSKGGDAPPIGDTAIALPTAGTTDVQPLWVSRMCDSVYSVAITDVAVYTGGHFRFQEAPGTADPWPGDARNCGWGRDTGGAGGLFPGEYLPRNQIGALDPLTGKTMDWNPGANSFEGVLALEAIDRGLLVGHDADRVGGYAVGRHAVFDFGVTAGSDAVPEALITSPFTNQVVIQPNTVEVAGSATAADGVDRVQFELLNLDTREWLSDDGINPQPGWNGIQATVADPGATATTWSATIAPPAGTWQIFVRSWDTNNVKDPIKDTVFFEVRDPGGDSTAPSVSIIEPSSTDLAGPTFTVSGTAGDDTGVGGVRVGVQDRDSLDWLQPDGSLGDYVDYSATLTVPGSTSTPWTLDLTVPEGRWTLRALSEDLAGNSTNAPASRNVQWFLNNTAPVVTVSNPAPTGVTEVPVGSTITFDWAATDDQLIDTIELRGYEQGLNVSGIGFDDQIGEFSPWRVVDDVDEASKSGTWTSPPLTAGRWQFFVRATDVTGLSATENSIVHVLVTGDAPPETVIDTPLGGVDVTSPLTLNGTATDASAVTDVRVTVRNVTDGRWVQPDGTLSSIRTPLPTTFTGLGTPSATFETTVTLPTEGIYALTATAFDDAGQHDLTQVYRTVYNLSNQAPTLDINDPINGAELAPGVISVNGRAYDDTGIARVRVRVRDVDGARWVQSDGSLDRASHWFEAFVTNPGGVGSNYSFVTPTAQDFGRWYAEVQAIDVQGREGPTYRVDFTFTVPGDAEPTTSVTSPAWEGDSGPLGSLVLTGTATDDVGVAGVEATLRHPDTNEYLQADGSMGSTPVFLPGVVDSAGATSTTWTVSYSLPVEGRWDVRTRAIDTAGQHDPSTANRSVWNTANASPAPVTVFPANNEEVDGTGLVVTGTVTDDLGVQLVRIRLQNRDTGQWLRTDLSFGGAQWFVATLDSPGARTSTWSWAVPVDLDPARWRVQVRVTDIGDRYSTNFTRNFEVE